MVDAEGLRVRRAVKEAINILLATTSVGMQVADTLTTIKIYMDKTNGSTSLREKEEFTRVHFSTFLQCLVCQLNSDWPELLTKEQQKELWDYFFLKGPPDQSFLVLLDSIASAGPSFRLMKLTSLLETFLRQGGLSALMWEVSQQHSQATSPLLQDNLLSKVVCLPDHLTNKLQGSTPSLFYPKNYFPLLGDEIIQVLLKISEFLRGGKDCSISFISQVLGKICVQGRREELLGVLVPRLSDLTLSDCIWQRICWRLVEAVPDRCMESVVTGLVQTTPGAHVLCRLLGNLVLKNRKAQFVVTQKLLLLQYGYKTWMLQSLIGYLALDDSRRPLLIKVLKELLQTWGSSSAVKHSSVDQQLYISKAILISLCHLKEKELETHRQELLSSMVAGVQCHLDSSMPQVRRIGMIIAESISARITTEGPCLKFQYEEDEQSRDLKSLLEVNLSESAQHTLPIDGEEKILCELPQPDTVTQRRDAESESEMDSDDELPSYDMSHDKPLAKAKAPLYIRDCLEVLVSSEDVEQVEVTLGIMATLIRRNPAATKEVSVELAKVLLHLEDKGSMVQFMQQRHGALVATTVIDPIHVSQYLTTQFYDLNYSLRQRMDILDVLASAAQELSLPKTTAARNTHLPAGHVLSSTVVSDPSIPDHQNWRKIVDERIKAKTRRFGKGASEASQSPVPNRFSYVAGLFFFPLIKNFDRPLVTFDLLGEDCLVLGRLVHTLGILMYYALNTTMAAVMAKTLMEFVWSLRFHVDTFVRQGLLFCISATILSAPRDCLLVDMTEELLETQMWLADVAEQDTDSECRQRALQSLLLLENLKPLRNSGGPE